MNDQLELVEGTERPWRLDAETRAAGRRGVAQAREALRQATARQATARQADSPSASAPTRAA